MRIAVAQVRATEDPWENLATVKKYSEEASAAGAQLVCFSENIFFRGRRSQMPSGIVLNRLQDGRLDETTSDFSRALSEFQKNLKLHVSLGSVVEQSQVLDKPYNSHWILKPSGEISAYHKIHLFTFHQEDVIYREADQMTGGKSVVSFEIGDFKFGLSICYDLRFPELYRDLVLDKGVNVILVPAAFTQETGRAHWHSLLRARAIENLSYVVASAQWGSHLNDKNQELWCYGHSLAYDPWGDLLKEAPEEGNHILFIDIDRARIEKVRKRLPSLEDIRLW
jgi:predicted amidohydrolase